MHEVRANISGASPSSPLVVSKARGKRAKEASLTGIPVPRAESRSSNQRAEERRRDLVDTTTVYFRRQKYDAGVVNVSTAGVMIDCAIEPRIGESVDIQFADCNRTRSVVRWVRDGRIGLEFLDETIILASLKVKEHVLGATDGDGEKQKPISTRSQRHGLTWSGTLYWTFEAFPVRLRNISATGAMLEGDCNLEPGAKVRLNLAEAGTVPGEVRWRQGGAIGVSFDEKFDVRNLAQCRPSTVVPINMSLQPQQPTVAPVVAAPPRRSIWKIGR